MNKKIAIFHNFMDNIGGAEIVCLTLAKELKADIYTTNINYERIKKMGFDNINIKSIGSVPHNAPLRQQMALWRFANLKLENKYDYYIIGGDWAISGAKHNKPNLWYVHSPIREIWDLCDYTKKTYLKFYLRPLYSLWAIYNRHLNRKYVNNVQTIACNSSTTQKRISKYLKRDATIIYPPIRTNDFSFIEKGNYWLSVNRLISYKRIEMQLQAFKNLPEEKLVIVGSYEKAKHFSKYANYITSQKPSNVIILNWIDRKKLIRLYSNCKGFITTSKEEDFGMNVVEAMASGKIVIAPNEGGYKETIINGKTGILIDDISAEKIISEIKQFPSKIEYNSYCTNNAKKFDEKIFLSQIKKIIELNGKKY